MSDLFGRLRGQAAANARHAVDLYTREVSEYRLVGADGRSRPDMLDFAVFIRRRSVDRAEAGQPLAGDDLATIADSARRRGERLLSLPSQQQVLGLHTTLMLREIHEAAGTRDLDALLRFVGWFGAQGTRARAAYLDGYVAGVGRSRSAAAQVELLTRMLVADEPADDRLAGQLGMRVAGPVVVCVVRFPAGPFPPREAREQIIEGLLAGDRVPMAWLAPDEFVFLVPGDGDRAALRLAPGGDPGREDTAVGPAGKVTAAVGPAGKVTAAVGLVGKVTAAVGRAGSVGTAVGRAGDLAGALESARRVSGVAPPEMTPRQLYTVDDLFVELGVAAMPWLDDWLRGHAERLRSGPDLLHTLDAYYRTDMNRLGTAAALHIHPRTLDYRLRRVRELTGLDPGSTRGVRVLSAAVARALAAGWG